MADTWMTEAQAADYLLVKAEDLKKARYRKKLPSRKLCGVVQYKKEWLDAFREGPCEEHQSLVSGKTPRSGTSRSQSEDVQGALARARGIVLKLSESSHNSSLSAKSRN